MAAQNLKESAVIKKKKIIRFWKPKNQPET